MLILDFLWHIKDQNNIREKKHLNINFDIQSHKKSSKTRAQTGAVEEKKKTEKASNLILSRSFGLFLAFLINLCLISSLALGL